MSANDERRHASVSVPEFRGRTRRSVLRIVLIYAVVASLWIFFSDALVEALLGEPSHIILISMIKGWLFIAVTALLLYLLVRRLAMQLQERQRSHELLATLARHSDDAIFAKDRDGRYLLFNPAAGRLVGKSPDQVLGRDDGAIFPPGQAQMLRAIDRRVLQTAETETNEEALQTARGTRVFLATKGPLRDDRGQVFGTFGISRDITRRKAAEAALREQDQMLNDMSTMAHVGGWYFDPTTGEGAWTPECARIHDLPEDAPTDVAQGLSHYRGEDRVRIEAAVQAAVEHGEPFDLELELHSAKGRRKWVRSIGHPILEQGRVVKVFGSFQDISGYKRTETALRESQERLQLFIDHAPAALAMFDRDMRYLAVSRRWLEDYGLVDRDVLGHSHYEIFPEIPDAWKAVHRRCLAGETVAADADRFERADGSVQWLHWQVLPWTAADGGVGGILLFTEDMTERVRAREEIERLNAGLEERIVARTAELSAANRELDAFTYAVSHDLRAPLRAMSGFSRALMEDVGDSLDGEAHTYLEQIDIAAGKMGALIDGLLTLSRSTRGGLRRVVVDVSALARQLLDELARGEPERQVAVRIEPGLSLHGDPAMLEVLLRNLLGNAWKYTAGTEAAAVRVFGEREADAAWVCVADNGAGFDMDHAEKLFQPFQRLHRQDEFPGIGIGLATVQRIVHRHGGDIRADGQPGRGARFCIHLPEKRA